jgi:hypothetical protein
MVLVSSQQAPIIAPEAAEGVPGEAAPAFFSRAGHRFFTETLQYLCPGRYSASLSWKVRFMTNTPGNYL